MPVYESEARLGLDVIPDLPSPQDLHRRFIPGNLIPPGQPSSEDESLELTVVDDYTMHLGEQEIVLGEHEIFLFNALLLLRDKPRTADELRSLGFTAQSSNKAAVQKAFQGAYEFLAEQLNFNGNQPLIAAEGDDPESAHYYLNPNLVVTDKRLAEASPRSAPTPPSRTALDFLIDHGTGAGEKEKAGPRGELYTRIVTLDRLPSAPLPQTGSPIDVAIVDNTTLRIGDKLVRLGLHERYLFNALMLRRDSRSAASELKSFGFYPGAKEAASNTAFYKATQDLSGHVNGAAGTEVIAKFGQKKATRYALNPNLVLRDLRTEEDLAREVIDIRKSGKSFGRSSERREIPNAGNLYARLIDSDRIPNIPLREGRAPIQVAIVDNTTLRIGDQDVRLSAHERYLFNALMLLRGQPNAAGELRAFGFYPNARNSTANVAFSKTINNLLEQLNGAAGVQILRRFGQKRSTRYIVNPDLMVVDFRSDEDRAAELDDLRPRNPRATAGAGEFRELTEEGDLYERVIDIERVPHMDVNDGTSIELLIDDNTTLRVGGHLIKLGRHERYLFNALMLLRGNPASGKELRQFGFFPDAKATSTRAVTFSRALNNLIDQINDALGVEAFKKVGERRNMLYAVNPNIVFNDLRTDDDKKKEVVDVAPRRGRPSKYPELEEGYMPNGKRSNYKGPGYEGYGADADHYDDNERRTLLITELVQKYKDHPQVQEALHKLNNGAPILVGPEQPYYRYLAEISQYDLLDPDDEVRLFKILENGVNLYKDWGAHEDNEQALIDAVIARQIVYLSNLRLVVEHAKRWAAYSKTMGRLDYVQEGNIGLADAIDRFDHTRGFRFSTYATWWVKQAIQRSQADKDRLIRIPVHMHDRLVNFSKTVRELTNELDRDPNPWEIASKLNESVADVLKLQGYIRMEPASLNALIEDSVKGPRGRVSERIVEIADPNDEIAQATQEAEDTAVVEALFSKRNLTLPEKYVVSFRLGFVVESLRGTVLEYTDGTVVHYDDLLAVMTDPEVSKNTLEEAAQLFGVTRERIRQIEKKGLDKIRLTYDRGKK